MGKSPPRSELEDSTCPVNALKQTNAIIPSITTLKNLTKECSCILILICVSPGKVSIRPVMTGKNEFL
jgi:hypothetical protein